MTDHEQPLAGGVANPGAVVRVGDTVRRPVGAHTPAVHALLRHLEAVGFEGAPRVVGSGLDERGREMLTFIEGDVALDPFPAWSGSDDLAMSVADLQRQMHEAAAGFSVPEDAEWYRPRHDQPMGTLVCHNDLCLENVVVRAGRAVAFIDFDWAAPSERLHDIAVACRHWVPLSHPDDLGERSAVDQVARFRAYCDEVGCSVADRAAVLAHAVRFIDGGLVFVRGQADVGRPGFLKMWNEGYEGRNRRSAAWLAQNADALAAA